MYLTTRQSGQQVILKVIFQSSNAECSRFDNPVGGSQMSHKRSKYLKLKFYMHVPSPLHVHVNRLSHKGSKQLGTDCSV